MLPFGFVNSVPVVIFLIMICLLFSQGLSPEDGIYFLIEKPSKLNYIYQINPSYHIGSQFSPQVFKGISMTYADPSEACQPIENVEGVSGEVVLIERGGCSFLDKVLNAEKAGAKIAIITDSKSNGDEFIDMISDGTKRKSQIPAAFLPGVSGKRLREYLIYENPILYITIPLNFTMRSLKDSSTTKPPWELW